MDHISDFIERICIEGPEYKVHAADLHKQYASYLTLHPEWTNPQHTNQGFNKAFVTIFGDRFPFKRFAQGNYFLHLSIRGQEEKVKRQHRKYNTIHERDHAKKLQQRNYLERKKDGLNIKRRQVLQRDIARLQEYSFRAGIDLNKAKKRKYNGLIQWRFLDPECNHIDWDTTITLTQVKCDEFNEEKKRRDHQILDGKIKSIDSEIVFITGGIERDKGFYRIICEQDPGPENYFREDDPDINKATKTHFRKSGLFGIHMKGVDLHEKIRVGEQRIRALEFNKTRLILKFEKCHGSENHQTNITKVMVPEPVIKLRVIDAMNAPQNTVGGLHPFPMIIAPGPIPVVTIPSPIPVITTPGPAPIVTIPVPAPVPIKKIDIIGEQHAIDLLTMLKDEMDVLRKLENPTTAQNYRELQIDRDMVSIYDNYRAKFGEDLNYEV